MVTFNRCWGHGQHEGSLREPIFIFALFWNTDVFYQVILIGQSRHHSWLGTVVSFTVLEIELVSKDIFLFRES